MGQGEDDSLGDGALSDLFSAQGGTGEDGITSPSELDSAGIDQETPAVGFGPEGQLPEEGEEFFEGGGIQANEYYDARDFIPEDLLETEFPFHFDDEAKYRSWDDAVKGTRERLRYLKQVITERDSAIGEVERLSSELAAAQAEYSSVRAMVGEARSDEEVEMSLAAQYLPEELRGVDTSRFNVSIDDYIPTWDDHFDDYKRRNPVKRDKFETETDYRRALFDQEIKAQESYRKKQARGQQQFLEDQRNAQADAARYNQAITEARSKVRAQIEEQKARARAAQEQSIRRLQEAESYLKREINKESLGIVNKEDEFRAQQLLGAEVTMYEGGGETSRTLGQVMVALRAQYGPEITNYIVEGIKSELGVSGSRYSANQRTRQRQAPKARPSRMKGGRVAPRRRGPAQEPSAQELFREAGFLAK